MKFAAMAINGSLWTSRSAAGRLERMWWAQGEGGQRLFVIPALQLVVAITSGNYGKEDQGIPPARILRDVVLESVRS